MRRLGTVLHITPRGSIIVRTQKTPPLGGIVLNSRAERVGKIVDVFGPVKHPYVSIRPFTRSKSSGERRSHIPSGTSDVNISPGAVVYVQRPPTKVKKAPKRRK